MLGISSFISKILTSKHWHMPKADTATFDPLHVTSLQGSKRKYNNVYELIKLITYYFIGKPQCSLLKYGDFYLVS